MSVPTAIRAPSCLSVVACNCAARLAVNVGACASTAARLAASVGACSHSGVRAQCSARLAASVGACASTAAREWLRVWAGARSPHRLRRRRLSLTASVCHCCQLGPMAAGGDKLRVWVPALTSIAAAPTCDLSLGACAFTVGSALPRACCTGAPRLGPPWICRRQYIILHAAAAPAAASAGHRKMCGRQLELGRRKASLILVEDQCRERACRDTRAHTQFYVHASWYTHQHARLPTPADLYTSTHTHTPTYTATCARSPRRTWWGRPASLQSPRHCSESDRAAQRRARALIRT